MKSLDQDSKLPQQDSNSHEHQFVLALAGVVTSECMSTSLKKKKSFSYSHLWSLNPAEWNLSASSDLGAVSCGRDFLSSSAHVLLDTLMELLGLIKPGVFPKLKV